VELLWPAELHSISVKVEGGGPAKNIYFFLLVVLSSEVYDLHMLSNTRVVLFCAAGSA
jgi:hypothetical protein